MQKCEGRVVWSFTSSLLVFIMIPGLAFFEGGLVRSKNTVSIITQVLSGHCVLTVMWIVVGFSLTFGRDYGGMIGDYEHFLLIDVPINGTYVSQMKYCEQPTTRGIRVLYELMFATISPLLITGAYAERLKYNHFLLFTILWELLIYYPVAHWIWHADGWMAKLGVVDFAGGIVIHATSGTSALIMAYIVGHRLDYNQYDHGNYPPSNMPLAAMGAALLWFGWGGFNAGGADAGAISMLALLNTHVAAAVSSMVWLILSIKFNNKARATAVMNGAIAGLAGITPAAGYVGLQAGMVYGLVGGLGSWGAAYLIKEVLHIDDALEVTAVHGVSGVIGALYIGVAANGSSSGVVASGKLFGLQLMALIVSMAWTAVFTFLIVWICRSVFGPLRVAAEDELLGLDLVEHQEVAYHDHSPAELEHLVAGVYGPGAQATHSSRSLASDLAAGQVHSITRLAVPRSPGGQQSFTLTPPVRDPIPETSINESGKNPTLTAIPIE
eukprot:PhF_6_TR14896/c1_g1_i1/m.23236/K03320/amt, AMT, MEP; ammonium transporter, Amt family